MRVLKAKVLGFCMGVRRAVEMAEAELLGSAAGPAGFSGFAAAGPGGKKPPVYTAGPLIHNPQTLSSLKDRGVRILDENKLPPDLAGSVVIIRAHGISPAAEAELVKRGARIADATCPKVKANQLKARSLFEAGYELFLAGEARHAEIIGILGYAPCRTVGGPEEAACAGAALFKEKPRARAALLGQTTISPGEYQAIAAAVKVFFPALEVIDTVCGAARDRQRSLRELCARAEIIIAAGGRDSANTRRLLAIARESGREAYQAESAADLPVEELRRHTTAGLCAGASTPDSVIAGIEEKLRSL